VSFQSGIFDEKNRENEHFWFEHFFFGEPVKTCYTLLAKVGNCLSVKNDRDMFRKFER
jgi:hypothetical protein